MKVIMEKTWLLQDRLVFTEMVSNDPHSDLSFFLLTIVVA